MSWLTKRVQTARLRGRDKKQQAKEILRRLRARAGENGTSRFLSGALKENREQEAPAQPKGEKGGQA